jgi:hypothetical protein
LGHSLAWPSGVELGADMLWLETLSATGHSDVRAFLEWRLRHALSLSKAADALGVSRRMVAYYSNGEKRAQADPAGLSGLGGQRRAASGGIGGAMRRSSSATAIHRQRRRALP